MKNKQAEMNSTLEGIHSRITEADAQINDLGDRMVEITATEQTIEKGMKRIEDSLRDLWDNIICMNIGTIWVPEAEEREKGPEKTFEEIVVENFPNVGKEIINQVQEAQKVPSRVNPRRTTLRHIVIKLTKTEDRGKILKATTTNNIQGNFHQGIR